MTEVSNNTEIKWGKRIIPCAALALGICIGMIILTGAYTFDHPLHYSEYEDVWQGVFIANVCGAIGVAVFLVVLGLGLFLVGSSAKELIKGALYSIALIILGVFVGLSFTRHLTNLDAWDRLMAVLPEELKTTKDKDLETLGIAGSIIGGATVIGVSFFTNCVGRLAHWLEIRGKALRAKLANKEVEDARL